MFSWENTLQVYMKNSPTQKKQFQNQTIYIKRDDLLSKDFSGNKARKFFYYLDNEFPKVKKIVSYGSNQSNAMYSLSVLANLKGWEFDYYVNNVSEYLKENSHGNYKYALENGMQLHVGRGLPTLTNDILFIEEGGRDIYAEYGLKILSKEIVEWKKEQGLNELNIFLPAGTGTTALYLQKNSQDKIFTTPCVGDAMYLKKQSRQNIYNALCG